MTRWVPRSHRPAIAVMSDGSAHPTLALDVVERAVQTITGEVRALGGFDAEVVMVSPVDADLLDELDRLPTRFHAVFLVQTDPALASAAVERAEERGDRLVVTEQDCGAIALCIATLAYLRSVDRPLDLARVVIAEGTAIPSLMPLLMIAGVSDLTSWQVPMAVAFPLEEIARDADVLIDLRPGSSTWPDAARIAQDRAEGSVLGIAATDGRSLLASGVLRVALACPPGSIHVDLSMLRQCALAVAEQAAMRWRRVAPSLVVDVVAAAARRVIDPRLTGS